jgi:uncharacterized repeat protein (TIGR01451 family)
MGRRGLVWGVALCVWVLGVSGSAFGAVGPRWAISSVSSSTNFAAGDGRGYDVYVLTVTNTGNGPVEGSVEPVVVSDVLPAGVTVDTTNENPSNDETGPRGLGLFGLFGIEGMTCTSGVPVQCSLENPTESVPAGAQLAVTIPVDIAANAPSGGVNVASVSGGGIPSASVQEQKTISTADPGFGFSTQDGFDGFVSNQDGSVDTQAGSHPFAASTSLTFNTINDPTFPGQLIPAGGQIRDTQVALPAGLIGNPTVTPLCSAQQFYTNGGAAPNGNACPANTAVGVANLTADGGTGLDVEHVPVYNLQPPEGTPALFGFSFQNLRATLSGSVRTGGDYGITISSREISQALALTGVSLTFWGVPADPIHDSVRGGCLVEITGGSRGTCPSGLPLRPFLTLPTACAGPQQTTVSADSWDTPGTLVTDSFTSHDQAGNPVGIEGCNRLDFSPSVSVQPDTTAASTPTGLDVRVKLPQNENPAGLGEADLKKLTLTLPAGMSVNPSAAEGLAACSPAQIGFERFDPATQTDLFTPGGAACPDASKLGSVEIDTPLLKEPVKGAIYLAQQGNNPFGSLLAIYLVAEGDGVIIKLAGHVETNPTTGQLRTTFDNNPQQPFTELKVTLFGGPRAALITPASCGENHSRVALTPWSSTTPTILDTTTSTTSNCPNTFTPTLTAGSTNNQANAFTSFSTVIGRSDGEQILSAISVQPPAGLLGVLAKVPLCGEPQAAQGTCSTASQIGHTTVSAGGGIDPVTLPQAGKPQDPVFLTGPYKGAPFGLSIVVPAEAGPFNLGTVVVRATINIDRNTGRLTITSDPLPTILQGIPLLLRTVNVVVDREGFIFNPTNCEALTVNATITSTQGASAALSNHFQIANCRKLPFKPKLTASTQAKTTRQKGASLNVKIVIGAKGEANVRKVKVQLPKQLPSRLTTLQKACTEKAFSTNPASCPAASDVGTAKAITPILNDPLTGPAYLVSHGGAAFPDLVIILQGQGVTIYLTGNTNIKAQPQPAPSTQSPTPPSRASNSSSPRAPTPPSQQPYQRNSRAAFAPPASPCPRPSPLRTVPRSRRPPRSLSRTAPSTKAPRPKPTKSNPSRSDRIGLSRRYRGACCTPSTRCCGCKSDRHGSIINKKGAGRRSAPSQIYQWRS